MQCGVEVISASVWSWGFPVCAFVDLRVAYNVFYAPHKSLGPYLQLALSSPPLRTCSSWPFSLVNYLHVKQWIKVMALRKMLLILREKKHISSWNLLPEACLSFPPHPFPPWEGDTLLFHTAVPFAQGKVPLPLILKYPLDILGMGWEDLSLMSFWKWKTTKECEGKVCETAQAAAEIPSWGRYWQSWECLRL